MAEAKRNIQINEEIYQLGTLVAGDFALDDVLLRLAEAAVRITGVKACSIRLLDEDSGKLKMVARFGLSEQYSKFGVIPLKDTVVQAAFAGEAVVIDDMRTDSRVPDKRPAIAEGIVSQLTVGMHFRKQKVGVLRLYSAESKHFGDDEIALARAVASQCATAITNARLYAEALEGARMAEQMRLAAIVQRRMIPERPPLVSGLEVAGVYIPCFELGGDMYDYLGIDETSIGIAIADVIGKGLPAALMMSGLRGMLRAYAEKVGGGRNSIAEIVSRLNLAMYNQCRSGEFVTMFYAVIDAADMTISYCSCGHEPALLIRGDKIYELDKGGLVLGVLPDSEFEIGTEKLQDGDIILFYTDGLIDAINFDGERWGKERMLEIAKKYNRGSASQMAKNLLRYRRRFTGLARQVDDTSIVVAKIDRRAEPVFMEEVSY